MTLGLVVAVVLIALAFTYINGFHDTANSIATVVATKVLTPGQAVLLAAATNLAGALWGTAVAKTIAAGLIDTHVVEAGPQLLICALAAATAWNLLTWWWGLPSSSSHALVGALVGAAIAASGDRFGAVIWAQGGAHWWQGSGVIPKVVVPMVVSPLMGFVIGFLLMGGLYALFAWLADRKGWLRRFGRTPFVNAFFGKAQIASASAMGLAHGMNDAQKSMGIIALALAGATAAGQFDRLPSWLGFLRIAGSAEGGFDVPSWVAVVCALTMAGGTAGGGWRIIKTLGHKMVKLHPINGFAAEGSSAAVILTASAFGIPVSTTHNVSASIMGVGAARRWNAIRWTVVERMVWAWILTLPITALLAYAFVRLAQRFF
ncbi:inorganic phosphate transporter [Fulvimonas soli]|jgi:PiT family inorganic phosphate transporter|uniref:Phosphate transporter n=1 Tax=Fulvimonas soli TaxID=155197 RepID=A0A316HM31_9GAMM|nr:inorganic phosphate transporter [Fulvimonas soli]PWK81580.1 PiT family inorganic phosphate transporter [Fulvimonas soli]TNY25287.1 inorganic phosphate transporter [Fulvimonas soli]